MPIESVRVEVNGANPKTYNYQVSVDPVTRGGSVSIPLVGVNGGTDTVQAFIDSHGYHSNLAEVAWQFTNGIVSLGGNVAVDVFDNLSGSKSWTSLGNHANGPTNVNTVVFNQVFNNTPIAGFVSPDGRTGGYHLVPPVAIQVTSNGTFAGDVSLAPISTAFLVVLRGNIVVSQPGIQSLYFLADDSWAFYAGGGATRVDGTLVTTPDGISFTPNNGPLTGLPLLGTRNTGAAGVQATDFVHVNFPSAGVFPFEIWWINGLSGQNQYFQATFLAGAGPAGSAPGVEIGGVIKPVSLIDIPPAGASGSGNLVLTPTGGAGNVRVQGDSITLNLQVQNVSYKTKPYLPLLEGTAGKINIFNDPVNAAFNLQQYNGQNVDRATAKNQIFKLAGDDNNSWAGRISVDYDGTNFVLSYNGTPFDNHVGATQLVISASDIAWFNSVASSFDLFQYSTQGGGKAASIEVDYLTNPVIATVSPTSIPADGDQHILTFTLAKPLQPLQNPTTFSVIFSGQQPAAIGAVQLVVDGTGWVTGFTLIVTAPVLGVSATATPSVTASGSITYLSGTSFLTQTVTYLNAVAMQQITWAAFSTSPPVHYAWSTSPAASSGLLDATSSDSIVLNATFYSRVNNIQNCQFMKQNKSSNVRTNLGSSISPTNSRTGIIGGQTAFLADFSLTINGSNLESAPGDLLGYLGRDIDGQTITFWDAATYELTSVDGGGGGGCPAVEMYVNAEKQVHELVSGLKLECLLGETSEYLEQLPGVELRPIENIEFSTELCFYIRAENGAEVIISNSTPVPTLEGIKAVATGHYFESTQLWFASGMIPGLHVITDVGKGPEWSEVKEAYCVGMHRVARLYCGGRNFAAGMQRGKYIYTHNIMPVLK